MKSRKPVSQIARELVTDYDNVTFDTGRFIMVSVAIVSLMVVLLMCAGAIWQVVNTVDHRFDAYSLGIGVASVLGGLATVLTGFGVSMLADNRRPSMSPTIPGTMPVQSGEGEVVVGIEQAH